MQNANMTVDKTAVRQEPSLLTERSLCHSDRVAFQNCKLQYRNRKMRVKRMRRETPQFVGDLTHMGVAVEDEAQRDELLAKQLQRVPETERQQVEATVRELIANDAEMESDGITDDQKEKLIRWTDPETGWELVAKPDSIGVVIDEGRGQEVLEVVDKKTAYYVRESHIQQLLFFGLVASLSVLDSFLGSIKLVARALRSKEERVLWYSRARTAQNLRDVRADIHEIEKAIKTDSFPPTTGLHCNRCPFREGCDAFKAWSTQAVSDGGEMGIIKSGASSPASVDSRNQGRRPFYLSRGRRYA